MKLVMIAAKKRDGKWSGAMIVDGDLEQVKEEMSVSEFTAVALQALLESESKVSIRIEIGDLTPEQRALAQQAR